MFSWTVFSNDETTFKYISVSQLLIYLVDFLLMDYILYVVCKEQSALGLRTLTIKMTLIPGR